MSNATKTKCPMCGRPHRIDKGGAMIDHTRYGEDGGWRTCEATGVRFDDAAFVARAPLLKAASDAAMERDATKRQLDQAHATFAAHSRNLPVFQAQATAAEAALAAYDAAHPRAV